MYKLWSIRVMNVGLQLCLWRDQVNVNQVQTNMYIQVVFLILKNSGKKLYCIIHLSLNSDIYT